MRELSVEQIVVRCQQGDEQAFGLLYTKMHDRLRRICRNYATDDETASDLLHDSFLLIMSKIGTIGNPRKAEKWMTTVTRNYALTWQQRQKKETTVSIDSLKEPLAAVAPVPMAVTYDEILNLIDALPQSYRRVFRLSVLEGMSHQEIAALLNIEPHTSSSQLYRAKQMLRRWLRPIVLLLIAVALPLGVWWLWLAERNSTKEETSALYKGRIPKERSGVIVYQSHLPHQQRDEVVTPPYTPLLHGREKTTRDTILVNDADSVSPSSPIRPSSPVRPVRPIRPIRPAVPTRPTTPSVTWSATLAYSGISSSGNMRLPYADALTNDAVCDTAMHHSMPLTVGLTVSCRLGRHWQVGLGLQYTRMTSDIEIGNTYARLVQQQHVQYLGLPLSVEWHQQVARRLSFYTSANVTLQLPLRSTMDSRYVLNGNHIESTTERLHPGTQWSVGVGLGLEYNISPTVGFFVEPRLQHYFQDSSGMETWQTEHKAALSVPFGLRINF